MWLDNKRVLITGGTGTIGSALLNKLLNYNIDHIYIFSRDEQKQDTNLHSLKDDSKVTYMIGDIRDYHSVYAGLKNIDIVFHTAAMKIVRICEDNPYEALKTNIIGTENIVRSAIENKVEKVIFTSSDKAANPTTAMGIGKLYGERLISYGNLIKGSTTIFTSVRFGNVLGSRGCVLDLFKDQIIEKDFVTVTHPDMTRFICTIDEAVDFLLFIGGNTFGGEVFIRKMPSIRIMDLAEILIEQLAPIYFKDPKSISIKITEKHPSEKLYEELVTLHEAERTLEFDDYFCILPMTYKDKFNMYEGEKKQPILKKICSNASEKLTKKELLNFLKKNKLI